MKAKREGQHSKLNMKEYFNYIANILQCLSEYNLKLSEQYSIIDKLTKENELLKQRIRDLEADQSQHNKKVADLQSQLKKAQDQAKKVAEIEKILADMKAQRDLLMKQIEQLTKEKELILQKFNALKEEISKMIIRMKEEFARFQDIIKDLERQLFEKDEELAQKEVLIKNLTQRQIEMEDQLLKSQQLLETMKDIKAQMKELMEENDKLRRDKRLLEQTVQDQNKLIEDRMFGPTD